jgi:RND family efflux transporter MFP subunit
MKNLSFIVLAIGSALALQGCEKPVIESVQRIQSVYVEDVALTEEAPQLTFPAVAAAADKSSLSFRIPGEVTHIYIRPGDFVKKGQLLAELDPFDYRLEVDNAQAKYNVADSQYRRSAKLVENGYIAQSQFDELKAQRRIERARLNIAKLNLKFTQIKAPFNGVVSRVPIEQFENVQAGQQVMNIHSAKMVDIHIQAPDLIYSKSSAIDINVSKPDARVITSNGSEYKASLKEFTTEPDPESGSFLVTLTMPMPADNFILDGMAVEVRADAQKLNIYKKGEPVIPLEAIFNEDGDNLVLTDKFVWVVKDDMTVEKRRITTDKVVPEGVRVQSGIEQGEKIVVAGGNRLRAGQQITIISMEAGQ